MLRDPINTADIPHVFDVLKNFLPSVLTTECFNDENLPFFQEVKKTEIGHLFEHILLEYMCQSKIAKGYKSAVYSGRTRWNWKRDPKGLFHIHISCSLKDHDLLPAALKKSIALMKIILQYDTKNILPNRQITFTHKLHSGTNQFVGLKNGKKLKNPTPTAKI